MSWACLENLYIFDIQQFQNLNLWNSALLADTMGSQAAMLGHGRVELNLISTLHPSSFQVLKGDQVLFTPIFMIGERSGEIRLRQLGYPAWLYVCSGCQLTRIWESSMEACYPKHINFQRAEWISDQYNNKHFRTNYKPYLFSKSDDFASKM